MKTDYPVVFLAFADDSKNPLELLEKEGYEIYRCLSGGARKLYFQLHREPFATTQKIADFLLDNKDRVHVFHYGGHSNSTEIFLKEENANAKGLASLFKELQKSLKLVFLNGCSTKGQVEYLLHLNIPAIIATNRPIDDQRAKEFAVYFYRSLVNGSNLEKAFIQAAAMLQTKSGEIVKIYRSIDLRGSKEEDFEWGLYIANPEVLKWELPSQPTNQIIIKGGSSTYNMNKVQVDMHLLQDLLDVLIQYKPRLSSYGAFENISQRNLRLVRRDIMDSLPAPLGEQIRKLFSADSGPQSQVMRTVSVERLRQLVYTYEVLMDIIMAIMLAQFWEARMKLQNLITSEELKSEFKNFFSLGKEERLLYDLSNMVRKLYFFFKDNNIHCFVSELEKIDTVLFEDEAYLKALQFMEELKKELFSADNKVAASEIESFCLQAEMHLGTMFKKWGFCANYSYVSVKGIEVINPRHKAPSFLHNKVFLDMVTAGYEDEEKPYPVFTDNCSIILMKNYEKIEEYLNLSPFVIDENALKKLPQTKIYLLSHYDETNDIIYYRSAFDFEEYIEVTNNNFPEIKEQFEEFLNLIF